MTRPGDKHKSACRTFERRRGSILIVSLLLSLFLIITGAGLLIVKSKQYGGTATGLLAARAMALAQAGMEDAAVKLRKDLDFPPKGAEDQGIFAYTEEMRDFEGSIVGTYTVRVDSTLRRAPYFIIRIASVGVAAAPGQGRAVGKIAAELDVAKYVRGSDNANPLYFRWVNWEESDSL